MYLVGRCDPELDLGTKMGPGRPKNKSAQNGLKTGVCIDLVDTNPTHLERAQMNVIFSIYRGMFITSNMQNKC
jgi:hypothetical protein